MEYPTPNPGPCRSCGKQIWDGGDLCSDCWDAKYKRIAKEEREHRELIRLRKQNIELKSDLKKAALGDK